MKWENMQSNIELKYKVKLEGWPADNYDLDAMGTPTLMSISNTLKAGTCYWRRLTDDEVTAYCNSLQECGQLPKKHP